MFRMRFLICNHVRKLALSRPVAAEGFDVLGDGRFPFPKDQQDQFLKRKPNTKNWFGGGNPNRNINRRQTKSWESEFRKFNDELESEITEDKRVEDLDKFSTDSWIHEISAEERMRQLERQFSGDDDLVDYFNPDDKPV